MRLHTVLTTCLLVPLLCLCVLPLQTGRAQTPAAAPAGATQSNPAPAKPTVSAPDKNAPTTNAANPPAQNPAATKPAPAPPSLKRAPLLFLKIQDRTQLMLGSVPYHNVGVNIPDLFERFLRGDEAGAERALQDAHAAGARFVRCWATAYTPDGFAAFETDQAKWLTAFDRMLTAADNADIALVPSLLYNIRMLPAYAGRPNGTPDTLAQYLTPGSRSNTLALAYINALVPRCKNDARVLFWEIGNEYNLEADLSTASTGRAAGDVVTSDQVRAFLAQMAARIHVLDKRHYVTSGNGDMRPSAQHLRNAMLAGATSGHPRDFAPDFTIDTYEQYRDMLAFYNPPGVDIVSVHQYPPAPDTPLVNQGASWLVEDGVHALRLPWTQYAVDSLHKPLFVGAFGQKIIVDGKEQDAPWALDYLRRTQTGGTSLTALYAWEFDAYTPGQPSFSLSPTRAPRMTLALATTNANILNAAISGATVVNASSVDVSKTAQQEDKMQAQTQRLHDIAVPVLKAAQARIGDTAVRLPRGSQSNENGTNGNGANGSGINGSGTNGSGANQAFVIRDAALMLGADLISADEVAGWARLIASTQAGPDGIALANGLSAPPYSICDHLTLAGYPIWFPGATPGLNQGMGEHGSLPPADSAFYFIQMVREHFRLTGKATLFPTEVKTAWGTTTIADACIRAFDSVAVDANGMVITGTSATDWRIGWGGGDTARQTGVSLMPSLLRWRAAKDLVLLFAPLGDRAQIARYDKIASDMQVALAKTFYHPLEKENGKAVGLLYSCTGPEHRDDVWASAYAVWSGALRSQSSEPVAQHLRILYQAGGTVVEGQIRALPPGGPLGGYWQGTDTQMDTGPNGAYWGFATGWYIGALLRVDRPAASQLLDEFVASLQSHEKEGAPWQCIFPAKNYTHIPQYVATVAAPYTALRVSLDPK